MIQKNNSVTSAGTKDEVSAKADVTTSSPNNAKPNVVRRFIRKLFCYHNIEKHIYTCSQDRYVETVCTNCGKHFFRDI